MVTLVPATPMPRPESDTAVFAVPADSLIPNDAMGVAIRRGRAIAFATRDSMVSTGRGRCAASAATWTPGPSAGRFRG
jgi:hypothetical protein